MNYRVVIETRAIRDIDEATGWVTTAVEWGAPNAMYRTLDGGVNWERIR